MGYTHGYKWTDTEVKKQILQVKEALCLDRMPTRNEIQKVMNNTSLTDRISRTKGYYGWAKELKLNIKSSETSFGKKYEKIIREILENKKYKVKNMSQNYHFDLLINENVRIDVKVAKPYKNRDNSIYHTFNLSKKYSSCDIYIIVCLDNNECIERLLIIPSYKCKITQLSIGKESIYNIYQNRFDFIDKYINFYNNLK